MEVKSKASSIVPLTSPARVESKKPTALVSNMKVSQSSIFEPFTHKPPRIDGFGYNKETHKGKELLNRNTKNILTEPDNQIPLWWTSKNIRDPKFQSTLSSPKEMKFESLPSTKSMGHGKVKSLDIDFRLPEKKTRTNLLE
jgi:hypothetical protein